MKKSSLKSSFFLLLFFSLTAMGYSQSVEVTGIVNDELGPMTGANILEKGTLNGTQTDFDGKFSIKVSNANAVLIFSYIGYKSVEIPLNGKTTINITLNQDAAKLDEVVLIGYGGVKKSDLTGSVTSISTKEIENIPVTKVGELLQGRSTGLQILNSGDGLDSGVSVRVRGASTLFSGVEPLVVLDGVPFGTLNNLDQINTSDIESIELLKDASATAIYGAQGANGVILVTTKKGKVGTAEVFVETAHTISRYTKPWERYTDMVQLATINNRKRVNVGQNPFYNLTGPGQIDANGIYRPSIEEFQNGTYTFQDWEPFTRNVNPALTTVKVGIRGGTEKNQYLFSGNFSDQTGQTKGNTLEKFTFLFKDNITISDKFSFQFTASFNQEKLVNGGGGGLGNQPWIPLFNADGSFHYPREGYWHPLQQKIDNHDFRDSYDVLANASLTYKPFKWLTVQSTFSKNQWSFENNVYQNRIYAIPTYGVEGWGRVNKGDTDQTYLSNSLTFNKSYGDHNVTFVAANDHQIRTYDWIQIFGRDFPSDALKNELLTSATEQQQLIGQEYNRWELLSYLGRLNYGYKGKYLLTASMRADGSSRFGDNEKWGYFPSGALKWRLSEENFLKDSETIDDLGLSVSYGEVGNIAINPYATVAKFALSEVWDAEEGRTSISAGPGSTVDQAGNPNLKWETTTSTNIALDASLYNNRIRLRTDLYLKKTFDLARVSNAPVSAGLDGFRVNDGEIENRGVEVSLGVDWIREQENNLRLSTDFNFTLNKNKVIDIGDVAEAGLIQDEYGNSFVPANGSANNLETIHPIGLPVNSFYGYVNDGLIHEEEDFWKGLNNWKDYGDLSYVDLNGDGIINSNDRTIIGDPNPDFLLSMNLTASYKNWSFSALLNGVFGNDVLDMNREGRPYGEIRGWTEENQDTQFPKIRNGNNIPASDFFVVDGSFVRLTTASLNYALKVPQQNFFKKANIYISGQNLFVLDNKFEGYDPETGANGKYDGGNRQARYTLGLNLTF